MTLSLLKILSRHSVFGIQSRALHYYITTPIFYANDRPHIGHVYTLLFADAINRYQRLKLATKDTLLTSGVDEHGIKVQQSALTRGYSPILYCKAISQTFLDSFQPYETTLGDFIKTSEERHKVAVAAFWEALVKSDSIYKDKFSGWYCVSDETFVTNSQVSVKQFDGKDIHVDSNDNELVWAEETNYIFKFNRYKSKVDEWLRKVNPVKPEVFNNEAIRILPEINDFSISRAYKKVFWGIQTPYDTSQTIYVWLDALANYLTLAGYPMLRHDLHRWPPNCQVFGKDILKFHAIYWPAFLLAAGLELPEKLLCHSHWLVNSKKMSKSRGNVVNPNYEAKKLTHEGLRYYMLRTATLHSDSDYNHEGAIACINAELANKYGNLLSRCLSKALNPKNIIATKLVYPEKPEITAILDSLEELPAICRRHYEDANFYKGIDKIMTILDDVNQFVTRSEPWKLVNSTDPESSNRHSDILTVTFEVLRVCSILLQPIIPRLSSNVLNKLNVNERNWKDAVLMIEGGDPTSGSRYARRDESNIIFTKIKN